jgi:peptidoglycan/LPS O-acetylase OafA/YrhL
VTREPGPDFADWTDLCRALAAMLVTVSHARDILMIDYHGPRVWLPWYALTGFGHSGVILFFVLSGFWISRSVLQRIDGALCWCPRCCWAGRSTRWGRWRCTCRFTRA